jgi:hypothetical protein
LKEGSSGEEAAIEAAASVYGFEFLGGINASSRACWTESKFREVVCEVIARVRSRWSGAGGSDGAEAHDLVGRSPLARLDGKTSDAG